MSSIVLVNPDTQNIYERFQTRTLKKISPQPPLGLCYIAANLQAAGHDVKIFDGYAESLKPEDLAKKIVDIKPDIAGFTITCLNIAQAEISANLLKQAAPFVKIVFGGPQVTLRPESICNCPNVDFGILGEGEYSFLLLVEALEKKTSIIDIPGLVVCSSEEKIKYTKHPEPISDLEQLPHPARNLLNWNNYNLGADFLVPGNRVFTLSTSRGCPYQCTYCSSSAHWNRLYRARSAVSVVDEIEILIREFEADGINFREDNFMVSKKRVKEICREIIKRNINIKWGCEARVDNIDRDILKLMREAGLVGVWCGVESGSPQILKEIKKGYTVGQVRSAFNLFHELNIISTAGFMIGFPDETEEDIKMTLDLAIEINPKYIYFQTYVAMPRGELYDYVENNNLIYDSWRDVYRVATRNIDPEKYPEIELDLQTKFSSQRNTQKTGENSIKDLGENVLIICSAMIEVIHKAIDEIGLFNPISNIDIFIQKRLSDSFSGSSKISEIYIYQTEMIRTDKISEQWIKSKFFKKYKHVIVLFSDEQGQGYDEVISVARFFNSNIITYNKNGQTRRLDS